MPKNLAKRTQTANYIKKIMIFHNFEHSSLPLSIIRQNKNYLEGNCM